MARRNIQVPDQSSGVRFQRFDIISMPRYTAVSLPAVVESDTPVPRAEMGDLRFEHLPAEQQTMGEYDGLAVAAGVGEVNTGTIEVNMRHSTTSFDQSSPATITALQYLRLARRNLHRVGWLRVDHQACDASSETVDVMRCAARYPFMSTKEAAPITRLVQLIRGALRPPPGRRRIVIAYLYGAACHSLFTVAVLAMILAMFFGMSESLGAVPAPLCYAANLALVLQFPVVHSLLLSRKGRAVLLKLAPSEHSATLSTTTYALVASAQLLALFALWTPSGIVWWRAEGGMFVALCIAYAAAWGLLIKASYDAGAEVQSGALGWMSLAQNKRPTFPDMPTGGLFRFIRQPIYVAFALTLWTVPVWTPDQFALAILLTFYCLAAPMLKERRFAQRYGKRFADYQRRVPYAVPDLTRGSRHD